MFFQCIQVLIREVWILLQGNTACFYFSILYLLQSRIAGNSLQQQGIIIPLLKVA